MIKTFVLYIGYPRSGSTISCKILSLHRDINISNQKHIIHKLDELNSFNKILNFIDVEKTKVVGTKDGHVLLEYLIDYPHYLDQLKSIIPNNIDLKFIHLIRNPYDNISSWTIKLVKGLKKNHNANISKDDAFNCACVEYDKLNKKILEIRKDEDFIEYKHENLIKNRTRTLKNICSFFNVEFYREFDNEVKDKLYNKPNITRNNIKLTKNDINRITEIKNKYDWLKEYKF